MENPYDPPVAALDTPVEIESQRALVTATIGGLVILFLVADVIAGVAHRWSHLPEMAVGILLFAQFILNGLLCGLATLRWYWRLSGHIGMFGVMSLVLLLAYRDAEPADVVYAWKTLFTCNFTALPAFLMRPLTVVSYKSDAPVTSPADDAQTAVLMCAAFALLTVCLTLMPDSEFTESFIVAAIWLGFEALIFVWACLGVGAFLWRLTLATVLQAISLLGVATLMANEDGLVLVYLAIMWTPVILALLVVRVTGLRIWFHWPRRLRWNPPPIE